MHCLVEGGMSPRIWLWLKGEAPRRNPGVGGQPIKKVDWGGDNDKDKDKDRDKVERSND